MQPTLNGSNGRALLPMTTKPHGGAAQPVVWKGRYVWLRRLRGDDAKRYAAFHAALDPARLERHVETALPEPDAFLGTLPSDDRYIMVAAIVNDESGGSVLGVARATRIGDTNTADIAIVLRPEVEGQGLGRLLMGKLVNDCRDCGLFELVGRTSVDNRRMIDLAHAFRFVDDVSSVPGIVSLRLQSRTSIEDQ